MVCSKKHAFWPQQLKLLFKFNRSDHIVFLTKVVLNQSNHIFYKPQSPSVTDMICGRFPRKLVLNLPHKGVFRGIFSKCTYSLDSRCACKGSINCVTQKGKGDKYEASITILTKLGQN